jgi:hypothetical protein
LLGRAAMSQAREARANYEPPQCSVSNAAQTLGEQQSSIISLLPARPNERLVYSCEPRERTAGALAGTDE